MTPKQAMIQLASILSAAAGFDSDKKKIPIIDSKNAVIGSLVEDCLGKNCESDVSQSFIRLLFRSSPSPNCAAQTVCKAVELKDWPALQKAGFDKDCFVQITETLYEENYSLIAVRCGGRDILHRIRQELNQRPFKIKMHEDFKEVPTIGQIIDVSAFSADDSFQDRAEAEITISFCDRSVCKVDCNPICTTDVIVLNKGISHEL